MDQSDGGMMNEDNQSMFFGASSNVDFVGGQNNPEQNYSNKVFAQNVRINIFKLNSYAWLTIKNDLSKMFLG